MPGLGSTATFSTRAPFGSTKNALSYYDGNMNRLIIVPQNLRLRVNTVRRLSLLISLAAPLFAFAEVLAGTAGDSAKPVEASTENKLIYKSVDDQGRVSFGDQPGANAVELETLERSSYQQNTSSEALQTRLDQMAVTTKRLQEDRKLRSKLRHDEAEARKSQYQAPTVVVENRVYRPRPYPYLYKPHHYRGEKKRGLHDSDSSLGLHLGGGSSTFHYGLSYGSQQSHSEDSAIQTPYRREQGHIRSSGLIKRRQN